MNAPKNTNSPTRLFGKKAIAIVVAVAISAFVAGWAMHASNSHRSTGDGHNPAVQSPKPAGHETHDHGTDPAAVWTCSMHPQIRKLAPGPCPLCAMDLIPATEANPAPATDRTISLSPEALALMQVQTSPVERRFVDATVQMVGKITYDETRVKNITAWVGGRIERLFVDYTGVAVKEGDHMAQLYSPDLLEAQEVLIQALRAVEKMSQSDIPSVKQATRATLQAARERLLLWGLSPQQVRDIEDRGTTSDRITINAPMGGIVVQKNVQEGMYVQIGTNVYTIADMSHLWVEFDAYESDLAKLRYGQAVTFSAEAFPGETFEGTIAFIDPVMDDRRRTVGVRVNVQNPDGRLRPGMFVRGVVRVRLAEDGKIVAPDLAGRWISPMHPEIVRDKPGICDICGMPLVKAEELGFVASDDDAEKPPLVVPATAVLRTGTRAIVYVQTPNTKEPTFQGREVVLGPRAGNNYIIKSNLKEGDLVVTHGNFKIDSALQLSAKPSMMNPQGGGSGGAHHHHHGAHATAKNSSPASPPSDTPAADNHGGHTHE